MVGLISEGIRHEVRINTGASKFQNELKTNGFQQAIVSTDDDCTFLRFVVACHEKAGNVIANIAKRDDSPIIGSLVCSSEMSETIVSMIKENPNRRW